MAPRRWFDAAWPDLADLAGGTEVGLVPVGAVEQHGPHLPTGTDTIIATALCEQASDRCGAPVLPAIAVGCSYGHQHNLPGNLSLSPEQLAVVVRQYAEWAASHGVRAVLIDLCGWGRSACKGAFAADAEAQVRLVVHWARAPLRIVWWKSALVSRADSGKTSARRSGVSTSSSPRRAWRSATVARHV